MPDRTWHPRRVAESVRAALSLLTLVPVRRSGELDRSLAGRAMATAPAVGLLLGLVSSIIIFGLTLIGSTPLLTAVIAVVALVALTGGLHLDGVADLIDGLASSRDSGEARRIMKTPEVGAFGSTALASVLLVQVAGLQACLTAGKGEAAVVLSAVVGRLALVHACTRTPAASSTGLGALVACTVGRRVLPAWLGALATAAGLGSYAWAPAASVHGLLLSTGLSVAVGLMAADLLRRHAVRRLGGLTGDVLGAVCELASATALIVFALGVGAAGPV